MKKLAILAVTAAALVLAAGKVEASNSNLNLTISGSVQYQVSATDTSGTAKTQSFNTASIYNVISNAVAGNTNGIATNLPAKGIIVFDPTDSDAGGVTGFFYVTSNSKTNTFFYPLSGYDTNGEYYSFMELDSYVATANTNLSFGNSYPFDGSANYKLSASGNGSLSGKYTALFYVHDNPYVYDIADNPDYFYGTDNSYGPQNNNQALVIQGILSVNLTYKTNSITGGSLSLTGTGNAIINGNPSASVISGHASL